MTTRMWMACRSGSPGAFLRRGHFFEDERIHPSRNTPLCESMWYTLESCQKLPE